MCRFNALLLPSTKTIIARENGQQNYKISVLEQIYYKYILNRILSIFLYESHNVGLTATDNLCKIQVSFEECYRAFKLSK